MYHLTENELATIAVNICYEVHKAFGPGLLESVYESAFAQELDRRGIPYTRQQGIMIKYDGIELGVGFRADIIMANKLLIEFKSVDRINPIHHKIVLNYLKQSSLKLAILVNFNVNLIKDGIFRKILGKLD